MDYEFELWLGRILGDKGWNWEFKGVNENDFKLRAELCDKFIEELQDIKEYYRHLAGRVK